LSGDGEFSFMGAFVSDELGSTTSRKACISCFGEYSGDFTVCPQDGATLTLLSESSLVGTILDDRYEILDVIGSGGMGMVYRARQRFINRMVAVKVLHKGSITGTEIIKRFQQEAQAASALTSPHVVTVFDSNVSRNGEPYLVMDLLNGSSLESLLEKEKLLPPARAIDIFLQICDALSKAHSKGIVHRDIKPSNIVLVEEDGQTDFVKVVDFGIAKILRESESKATQLTRTGEVFGSPLYMSPEQWRGASVDSRTDIYSLGAVMYKTLTGVSMFDTTDILQLAYKQAHEIPASITSLGIRLPDGLEAIVFKALAKDASERFQSVNQMASELTSVREIIKSKPSRGAVSEDTQAWLRELAPANQNSGLDDHTIKVSCPPEQAETSLAVPLLVKGDKSASTEKDQTLQLLIPRKYLKIAVYAACAIGIVFGGSVAYQIGVQSRLSKAEDSQSTTPTSNGSARQVQNALTEPFSIPSVNASSSSPSSSAPTAPATVSPNPVNTAASGHSAKSVPEAKPITEEEHTNAHHTQKHAHTSARHSTYHPGLGHRLKRILRKAI
jgi:serine/threonine protein kinase